MARLRKRGAERIGRRVLSDDEIRLFWPRIVTPPPVSRITGLALRLALLTGTRASEAAGASRPEFSGLSDPAKAIWIIPGERTKNKRQHLIPLSRLALEVVAELIENTTAEAPYIFPSPRTRIAKPIAGHSLAVAMERFAAALPKKGDEAAKSWRTDPPTPHDLRRTLETRLSSLGIPKEDRDAVLNHVRHDIGSKHYDLYDR
jgi:integrase